jgi:hypothetical protein
MVCMKETNKYNLNYHRSIVDVGVSSYHITLCVTVGEKLKKVIEDMDRVSFSIDKLNTIDENWQVTLVDGHLRTAAIVRLARKAAITNFPITIRIVWIDAGIDAGIDSDMDAGIDAGIDHWEIRE